MEYESNILKRLIDTYGVVGNPRYISEIIKEFIVQGKERFPNLFTYQADWLAHIDEFGLNPTYTVSYTGQSIYAPNTLEKPVKSAILKGNTLVNLLNKLTVNAEVGQSQDWYSGSFVTETVERGKYILLYNVKETSPTSRNTPRIMMADGTYLYEGYDDHNLTTGIKKWIFTANSDITEFSYRVSDNTGRVVVEDFILLKYQDGMENRDIPYFEGMQSVQTPVLTTCGKNLLNNISDTDGWVDITNIFKKDTTYILSADINNQSDVETRVRISIYNSDGSMSYYGEIAPVGYNGRLSTKICHTEDFYEVELVTLQYFGSPSEGVCNITNYQLEIATTATAYEPYKSNILTVNEDVELRGIGDVKDELDLLTGEVTQRIGEVVLDGSDSIEYQHQTTNQNTLRFFIECFGYDTNINTAVPFLTDSNIPKKHSYNDDEESIFSSWGGLYIRIAKEKLTENSVKGFKLWLSQNPITIQYQLVTSIVKTVDLTILDQNGQNVKQLMSFNDGTHFNTKSSEGSPLPTVVVSVETDLEETIKVCSLEGNTL